MGGNIKKNNIEVWFVLICLVRLRLCLNFDEHCKQLYIVCSPTPHALFLHTYPTGRSAVKVYPTPVIVVYQLKKYFIKYTYLYSCNSCTTVATVVQLLYNCCATVVQQLHEYKYVYLIKYFFS